MRLASLVIGSVLCASSLNAQNQNKPEILTNNTNTLYPVYLSNAPESSQKVLEQKRQNKNKRYKKLGSVTDTLFSNVSKDYNLLNLDSGLTFWEEWKSLENGDKSVITDKYPTLSIMQIAKHIKPDLIHFMAWMKSNPVATFKSIMANDDDGILELEGLKIDNAPYEIKGPTYVVTKFKDVKEALDNPSIFSVRNYRYKMLPAVKDFMLAYDEKPINEEHNWARSLIDVKEMEPRIRPLVRSILENELKSLEYIKENPYTKKLEANIEVVNQIARRVPAILTIKYFGFEGFTPEKIMEWSRATQDDFFHNVIGEQYKADLAIKAGKEMHEALVKLVDHKFKTIESIKEKPDFERTILDRMIVSIGALDESQTSSELLEQIKGTVYINRPRRTTSDSRSSSKIENFMLAKEQEPKDEELKDLETTEDLLKLSSKEIIERVKTRVRTNLIGTLVGGIETTQAAIVQTLNLMFQDQKILSAAKTLGAAATLNPQNRNARRQFNNLIWEVLRFHPVNPVVFRYIEEETMIGGVRMKAKSHIMIATQAAMFDPDQNAFPEPDSIILNRFKSMADDKYFHLGHGHHRCLGDYVSMIQVPEVIAGILELPNVRPVPGEFGQLDFTYRVNNGMLFGDKKDTAFPEKMILEYDSSPSRPLVKKAIEIQNQKYPFEAYLNDYDRNHFRGCMSTWSLFSKEDGEIFYSPNGIYKKEYSALDSRHKITLADLKDKGESSKAIMTESKSKKDKRKASLEALLASSQGFNTNLDEKGNDLLYCRLPVKYHACFEVESQKYSSVIKAKNVFDRADKLSAGLDNYIDSRLQAASKVVYGQPQYEIRLLSEQGDAEGQRIHKSIYSTCSKLAQLTDTEKAFYENRYFNKSIKLNELSLSQSQRPEIWDKDYSSFEDYFSGHERMHSRGSFTNSIGWFWPDAKMINFYTRLNFKFRMCLGKLVAKQAPRCEAYHACKNGQYNHETFKFEGALSMIERKAYNDLMSTDKVCEVVK